jgi:hypothetical protein
MAIKLTSNTLTKNLARRTKLVQHLDAAFKDFDENLSFSITPKEGDDAWHPSGDCTPNVVELYDKAQAKLRGEDTFGPISPALQKTFLVGHFWHEVLQHLLVHKLEFCDQSHIERRGYHGWGKGERRNPFAHIDKLVVPNPFHWATGSADVAPCSIPKYGDYLVDFKTMSSQQFMSNQAPDWAVGKWECQTNIYMDWFDLDKALIIGVQKDSPHDFREFEFHRNQPLIDAIYEKWKIVGESLDEGNPPYIDWDPGLPLQGVVES